MIPNQSCTKTKKSFLIPTCQQQACDFKAAESSAKNKRPFLAQNVATPTFNCHAHFKYLRQNLTQFFLPSQQSSSEALSKGGNFIGYLPVQEQCLKKPAVLPYNLWRQYTSTHSEILSSLSLVVVSRKVAIEGGQLCHAAVKTEVSYYSPVLLLWLL